jgi:hypothetical protein
MSYNNAGPIVFNPDDVLDSPNGAVTNADFNVLDAVFEAQFDSTYQSLYCYIGTVSGPDVAILRMQHDGTNILFSLTAKDDYADVIHFSNTIGAKALNTYGTVSITHDTDNLYSVYLDGVLINSATIAAIDMGDGVFHLGYLGTGTATVRNIDVSGVLPDTEAPTISTPTGTKTGSATASGSVSTDEANGTLYFLASTNASDTASTIISNGSSQAVSGSGAQAVSFAGLTPGTNYYAHYVHVDAANNQSNVVSSAQFTTDAPSFGIDSISDATPDAGSTPTILLSNESGTVTASCSAGALTGTYTSGQFVLDVPEPGLFGDLTLNYLSPVVVTLSDGANTDTISIPIQVPAGELFAEITDIDSQGIYANDAGLVVGDFAHIKNIVGDIVIDPATGLYSANPSSNVSFDYSLYDTSTGDWSDAYQTNSYTAETVIPVITLRGGTPLVWVQGVSWVDPGADVSDNVDTPRIISADTSPNVNTVGAQVIAYNATDNAGNVAVEVTRTVNVVASDSTPNQFTFTDVSNAELNTLYESIHQLTGVDVGQTVTATNGQVSNDGGASWSSSAQFVSGQTYVKAALTTTSANSIANTVTVTVNGISDVFIVTTKAAVTLSFSLGSSDPLVELVNTTITNLTYTFPIGEVWTAAPEEGGTLVDSTTNIAITNGVGNFVSSAALPATNYLVILRNAGNLPTRYARAWGQFA